jgi:hypothetical protein
LVEGLEVANQKSLVHATPNGGVKSIMYYRDADGNPADETVAVQAEIVELDEKNNIVFRTYGYLKGWAPPVPEVEKE